MGEPGGNYAPRWEWRTFGARLPEIKAKLGLAARIAPRRSDEIYLLNSATPHSAKIRGGVLEVKRLLQVNSSGLEQWTPAFKERFPLSAPMLRSAFAALDLRPVATRLELYDLGEFLAEVASNDGPLRAVEVKKARLQFMYRDCAAEIDRVRIGPVARESFCIESEDPSKVIAAVQEMGLDPQANINFSKGIERALAHSTRAG
jgi:exopolyphosphatase / guanosine-5'-triphosphate,3'-diphosphate pyrophosphatase